jgi:hemoglobin
VGARTRPILPRRPVGVVTPTGRKSARKPPRPLAPAAVLGLHYVKNRGGHHGSFGESVMRMRLAVAALVLACGVGLSHGQDGKDKDKEKAKEKEKDPLAAARAETDKKAAIAAYEAAVIGTDIFNKDRNYEGCYRLYQGTLMGLLPAIDHHPTLVGSIRDKLSKAKAMQPGEGAGLLREALEEVQELNRAKRSLWDRIGGEEGARLIVAEFVSGVLSDPRINYTRGGKFPINNEALQKLGTVLLDQLSFMTGGPGKDQMAELKKMHAGINFTEVEARLLHAHFTTATAKARLRQTEMLELGEKVGNVRKELTEEKK